MRPAAVTSLQLKPFLERCGYGVQQLTESNRFGAQMEPLAGLVSKPWMLARHASPLADQLAKRETHTSFCHQGRRGFR